MLVIFRCSRVATIAALYWGHEEVQGDENVIPEHRRRLARVYRIVHELALDPKTPFDHPVRTASFELAYLVGYYSADVLEEFGHDPLR